MYDPGLTHSKASQLEKGGAFSTIPYIPQHKISMQKKYGLIVYNSCKYDSPIKARRLWNKNKGKLIQVGRTIANGAHIGGFWKFLVLQIF